MVTVIGKKIDTQAPPLIVPTIIGGHKPINIVVTHPSTIVGTIRKTIEVSQQQLNGKFSGTDTKVVMLVQSILQSIILNDISDTMCIQWGVKEQKQYGLLVEESIALISHPSVQNSTRNIVRLLSILEEVADCFQHKVSYEFWKKSDTPWDKFQKVHGEIKQLSILLHKGVSEIEEVRTQFDTVHSKYNKLRLELEALALSAKWLSDALIDVDNENSQRLLDRSLNLLQTTANIHNGEVTRKTNVENLENLISKIQHGVLVRLPAWIEQVCSFQSKSWNETDVYVYKQSLSDIVNILNK